MAGSVAWVVGCLRCGVVWGGGGGDDRGGEYVWSRGREEERGGMGGGKGCKEKRIE